MNKTDYRWTRSANGLFGGVCAGLAQAFRLDPWVVRLIWLFTLCFYGTGFVIYILLWISFPRANQLDQALDRKILGVCANIAKKSDYEVGLIRLVTTLLATGTLGLICILYVALYLVENLTRKPEDLSRIQ